jgi:chorismate mutase/prephenate dehydratase
MSNRETVYLGPAGTFAYEVAKKRYGHNGCRLVSKENIEGVCKYVARRKSSRGIVPIENSSGGYIYSVVDALLDDRLDLHIEEELSIDVKLALLARQGDTIERIYTHFVPKHHCRDWLQKHHPTAKIIEVGSTACAAREASSDHHSAALSNRIAAKIYHLDVITYPIPSSIAVNVTQFFVLRKSEMIQKGANKTTLAVKLTNHPGSLYDFLKPFADAKINLSRIISRPIEGKPKEAAFLIDIDEDILRDKLANSLLIAKKHAENVRVLGSYLSRPAYCST